MKVETFSLCDFASIDAAGKLNLIGIFDIIATEETPATWGLCALAAKLRFDVSETGLKKVGFSILDPEGKPIMKNVETSISVQIGTNLPTATAQIVSIIGQLRLPCFGEYRIDLAIDGKTEASIPFFVRKAA